MAYVTTHNANLLLFWLLLCGMSVSCSMDWNHPVHGEADGTAHNESRLGGIHKQKPQGNRWKARLQKRRTPDVFLSPGSHLSVVTPFLVRLPFSFCCLSASRCDDSFLAKLTGERKKNDVLKVMETNGTGPFCFHFYVPCLVLTSRWNGKEFRRVRQLLSRNY